MICPWGQCQLETQGNSFHRTQVSPGWPEIWCISHDMPDYNLVTDNPKMDGLRKVYLSLFAYHRLAGALLLWDPSLVLQQRQGVWLPPRSETHHLHPHYTDPHKSCGHTWPQKGRGVQPSYAQEEESQGYQRTALLVMIPRLGFFRTLFKDIFRAPPQSTSTCLKMQRENVCYYPIFSCSNMLYISSLAFLCCFL